MRLVQPLRIKPSDKVHLPLPRLVFYVRIQLRGAPKPLLLQPADTRF